MYITALSTHILKFQIQVRHNEVYISFWTKEKRVGVWSFKESVIHRMMGKKLMFSKQCVTQKQWGLKGLWSNMSWYKYDIFGTIFGTKYYIGVYKFGTNLYIYGIYLVQIRHICLILGQPALHLYSQCLERSNPR